MVIFRSFSTFKKKRTWTILSSQSLRFRNSAKSWIEQILCYETFLFDFERIDLGSSLCSRRKIRRFVFSHRVLIERFIGDYEVVEPLLWNCPQQCYDAPWFWVSVLILFFRDSENFSCPIKLLIMQQKLDRLNMYKQFLVMPLIDAYCNAWVNHWKSTIIKFTILIYECRLYPEVHLKSALMLCRN